MTRTRIGLAIVGLTILIALFGPLFAPHSPTEVRGESRQTVRRLFGADALGRDVWSRFLHGGRTVLWMAAAAAFGIVVETVVGLVAAYSRGWLDDVLMRAATTCCWPFHRSCSSCSPSPRWAQAQRLIVLTVGLTHAAGRRASCAARRSRWSSGTSSRRPRRWARSAGGSVFGSSCPTSCLLVETGLRMTYSIGLVAAISFLGFGLQPPTADWGLMINENRLAITSAAVGRACSRWRRSVCLR